LAANTDTAISFGTVPYDDLLCFSLSAATLTAPGDYLLATWLRFDVGTATTREVWFAVAGTTIARKTVVANATVPMYLDLAFPFRAAGGEVVNVLARSGVATAISMGAWTVTRIGSGPPGPIGPQGIQGAVGATGAAGPAGPSGTANSGFVKYADLLPH
jgi:hypothetical protein